MVAAIYRHLPGADFGASHAAGLKKLCQLGYFDEHQNIDALERSAGNIDKAINLIKEGVVPDIEQGYTACSDGPTQTQGFSWRSEFNVTKVIYKTQEGEKRGVDVTVTVNREGVSCWPREGGQPIASETWLGIKTFTLAKNHQSVSLRTANGELAISSRDSKQIMDTILGTAKKLAAEMKASKLKKSRHQSETARQRQRQIQRQRTVRR